MMRLLKYMTLVLLMAAVTTTVEAKRVKVSQMYLFGFSASFVDSTLYITDIQEVKDAWYETKDGSLLGRENYSFQLKEYFADKLGQPNRVCLVLFATSKKKAEKKYQKLKKKYVGKDGRIEGLHYLTAADFRFNAVDMAQE